MIAYYKAIDMSLDKSVKRLSHRIILKSGNTDICLDKNGAHELRSSLNSALITMEIAELNQER